MLQCVDLTVPILRSYGTPKCMTSYHSLSLTNPWNVENGWPIFRHRPQMFPFRNTRNSWEFFKPPDPWTIGRNCLKLPLFLRENWTFISPPFQHGVPYENCIPWFVVGGCGRALTKKVIDSLTPCPIQGAVMPASCASIADEPTWLRHQMALNHHGHYVTVIILTCPEWWGKLGQSDVCWVNMMTNKDSQCWFAMGQNHYECQTSQCGFRVVNAKCISK